MVAVNLVQARTGGYRTLSGLTGGGGAVLVKIHPAIAKTWEIYDPTSFTTFTLELPDVSLWRAPLGLWFRLVCFATSVDIDDPWGRTLVTLTNNQTALIYCTEATTKGVDPGHLVWSAAVRTIGARSVL
jgi:hypothetical protein